LAIFLAAALVSVAIAAAVGGLYFVLSSPREQLLDRMERATQGRGQKTEPMEIRETAGDEKTIFGRMFEPIARLAKPQRAEELSKIRAKLSYAGYRGPSVIERFYLAKILLSLFLCGGLLAFNSVRTREMENVEFFGVFLAAIGFYAPNMWLRNRISARQNLLNKALPDTLDLLVTCVEAGLGIEAALMRITQETQRSSPELASELGQTQLEIQAGMSRSESFRRLAERTGLEELRILAGTLIQTEMFGTSVARALRVHSDTMRTKRTHRAEEAGATVAVKLLLPLIFFILPSLFAVILGPAVVRIFHVMIQNGGVQ